MIWRATKASETPSFLWWKVKADRNEQHKG
jgi:hypothetical protein